MISRKNCILYLLFLTLFFIKGWGQIPPQNHQDEIAVMDNLIENTTQLLEAQKQMRQLIVDFLKQKRAFAEGNQSKAHAAQMVRTARNIYENITSHHLEYLFSQEYLDELLFFSSIAGKNKIKQP